MANDNNTVIYVGVTGNLPERVHQHKQKNRDGFTKRYACTKLVYFEHFEFIDDAIAREKQIKKFRRQKKNQLIDDFNPGWNDMLDESF